MAYNGIGFDLKVLKQCIRDDAEYQSFESKCHDPFAILRGEIRLS